MDKALLETKLENYNNSDEPELILASQQLTDENVLTIVRSLSSADHLISLNLANNQISKSGASYLIHFLETHPKIERLNLCANFLEDKGCQILAEAFRKNKTLKDINLSRNHARNNGVKAIIEAFADNPSHIESLNFSMNEIRDTTVEIWSTLKELPKLKELDLSYNQLSNKSIKTLVDGLKNSAIETLHLHHNDIDDKGIGYLADMLPKQRSLLYLDLSANKFTDEGGEELADALESNPVLNHLNIAINTLTDKTGVALAEALWVNTRLKTLLMRNTALMEPTAIAFAESIQHNPTLSVFEHPNFPPSTDKAKDAIVYLTAYFEIKDEQRQNRAKIEKSLQTIETLIEEQSLPEEKLFNKVKRLMSQLLNNVKSSVELNDTSILQETLLKLRTIPDEIIIKVFQNLFQAGKFVYAKPLYTQLFPSARLLVEPSPLIPSQQEEPKPKPSTQAESPVVEERSVAQDPKPPLFIPTIEDLYQGLCEVSARLYQLEQQVAALSVPPLMWQFSAQKMPPEGEVGQRTNIEPITKKEISASP